MALGAAAQGADLHNGETLYAANLPYCTTLADAEKVAEAGRKTGNGYAMLMQNDNCKSGHGIVVVMRQIDRMESLTQSAPVASVGVMET